jgi:hypothetical protein
MAKAPTSGISLDTDEPAVEGAQPETNPAAEQPEAAAEPAAEDPAADPAPESTTLADENAADEPAVEGVDEVDPALTELNSGLIAMAHPDGGTCDAYETDADGNLLVPASDAASMIEHGFVLAAEG